MSRVTLRLVREEDRKGGDDGKGRVYAKLSGQTLSILQRCLVRVHARLVYRGTNI